MKYIPLFILLLGIFSCGSQKEVTEGASSQSEKEEEIMGDPVITLTKGACFGTCPVYTLSIMKGGKMIFEGQKNTSKLGIYSQQISLEQMNELISLFEKYKFMELQDFYESRVADLPATAITYTKDGVTKKVVGKMERPQRVRDLEDKLTELAESDDNWTLIKASENLKPNEKVMKDQIIITTTGGPQLARWFDKMRTNHGLRIVKRLSAASNTWLVSYNTKEYSGEDMLKILRSDDFIRAAEYNIETEKR